MAKPKPEDTDQPAAEVQPPAPPPAAPVAPTTPDPFSTRLPYVLDGSSIDSGESWSVTIWGANQRPRYRFTFSHAEGGQMAYPVELTPEEAAALRLSGYTVTRA